MHTEKGLPNNWRKKIKGKKVILYVTSVGNLLLEGERHIDKIIQVLSVFRDQDEVMLWWRPHPLELSTVEAMRPELVEKYQAARNQYAEEEKGILDESADVHRAIAVSDAYYGDWSSLVQLYKVTGKPVLLSNDNVVEYSLEPAFYVCDFVVIDDYMWFVSSLYTGIFKMNMKSLTVESVVQIPGERIFEQGSMRFIVKIGSKLFLIPDWGENIIVYNLNNAVLTKINIGKRTTFSKFSEIYHKDGSLYLKYAGKRIQLKIDAENLTTQLVNMESMEIQQAKRDEKYIIAKKVNDLVYAFPYFRNAVHVIDSRTGAISEEKLKISSELEKILCHSFLFDVYESDEPSAVNHIYAGEQQWVFTLPRYIEAVVNETDRSNVIDESIRPCGKKIYESMYQE